MEQLKDKSLVAGNLEEEFEESKRMVDESNIANNTVTRDCNHFATLICC